ncbi:MAG: DNA polymerase III subunit alpha, partial [Alicyclobacillaceae bacterium]|nr:DNA polymerase III subunit alpha [Alicyclobacillaceae bacterium]
SLLEQLNRHGEWSGGAQLALFDEPPGDPAANLPDDEKEKVRDEKQLMGVTFTGARVYIRLDQDTNPRLLAELQQILERYPGRWPVRLYRPGRREVRELGERWRVRPGPGLTEDVEMLLGPGSIVYHLT